MAATVFAGCLTSGTIQDAASGVRSHEHMRLVEFSCEVATQIVDELARQRSTKKWSGLVNAVRGDASSTQEGGHA